MCTVSSGTESENKLSGAVRQSMIASNCVAGRLDSLQ